MAAEALQNVTGEAATPEGPVDAEVLLVRALPELNAAVIGLWSPVHGVHEFVAPTAAGAEFPEGVIRHAAPALMRQIVSRPRAVIGRRIRSGSTQQPGQLIAVAVGREGRPLSGVLCAVRAPDQGRFTARELRILRHLARDIAAEGALERAGPRVFLSRAQFEEEVERRAPAAPSGSGILYGDLDQMHALNKRGGFAVGDRAIAAASDVLVNAVLPAGACACHLSGDRFTLFLPETTLAQTRAMAEMLCNEIGRQYVEVAGLRTRLSISFGVAQLAPQRGGAGHALAAAEAACKAAKDRGRGRVEVYQDADQSIVSRNDDVVIASKLREALDAGRIEVLAQPLVPLRDSDGPAVEHFELLARLVGDSGVLISPADFMSAATRFQMLPDLDRAVLKKVFDAINAVRPQLADRKLRFSLNLSGPTISDPEFLEWVASSVGGSGIPGEWLQFELTETAAVANVAQTQAMFRRLRSRGVHFALDDFGTGVSSLAYLKAFNVQMLKLDGTFIRDVLVNSRSQALVEGVVSLARSLGIETVAECVESTDVRDRLQQLGVDRAQGFLFGQPQPFRDVIAALTAPSLPAAAPSRS
ncbi:MAG: EAL domain-containing protein [Gammaproteobacteria bacterium]